MASKVVASAILVFRISAFAFAVATVVVFLINTVTLSDGSKVSFKDVTAYRYVFSTAVIGAAYSLIQLPFALYYAASGKRMIRGDFLPEFDFYVDKVISFLLATGVGVGFAVTHQLKEFLNDFFEPLADFFGQDESSLSSYDKFLNRVYIATALLSGAFICMAVLSMLSSLNFRTTRTTTTTRKSFF